LLLIAAGCTPMPTVALQATPADLEMLAGDWLGEYESAALGRRGSIEFKLKAGTDEAFGDVLMVPSGRQMAYERQPHHTEDGPNVHASELLTIRFIRASNGSLSGALDRYWDPDRNCFANTSFRGNVGKGVVEGTFTTTFECGVGDATGTWSASKKPGKAAVAWR
jgi:hypothetical protein